MLKGTPEGGADGCIANSLPNFEAFAAPDHSQRGFLYQVLNLCWLPQTAIWPSGDLGQSSGRRYGPDAVGLGLVRSLWKNQHSRDPKGHSHGPKSRGTTDEKSRDEQARP